MKRLFLLVGLLALAATPPPPPELPPVQPAGLLMSIYNVPPAPTYFEWQMPDKTNVLVSSSTNLVDWTPCKRIISLDGESLTNVSFGVKTTTERMFFKVE